MSGKDHPSSFPAESTDDTKRELMKGRPAAGEAGALRQAGSQSGERTEEEEEEEEGKKKLQKTELETLIVACTWQEKGTPLKLLGFCSLNLRVMPKGPL
jgi:hypothetical protein